MFDSESWSRLIQGLVEATEREELTWERRNGATPHGSIIPNLGAAMMSSLTGRRFLRAKAKSGVYELSSDAFGGAPYSLTVWERSGENLKPIDHVKSSTDISKFLGLNMDLERLYKVADASVVDPQVIVDRLLGDFSTE